MKTKNTKWTPGCRKQKEKGRKGNRGTICEIKTWRQTAWERSLEVFVEDRAMGKVKMAAAFSLPDVRSRSVSR